MGIVDHWLVWRLRQGDPEACRELISRYHVQVYGYLIHLAADPHLAEDLTQETYAKAWQHIADVRRSASLRSWLLTIARNEYLQRVRSRHPVLTTLEEAPDPPDPSTGILEWLEESERDRALRRAVGRLDPSLREVIALHYFDGLSLREIGSVLEIPTGTAKSRVNRALQSLRNLLEADEEKSHVQAESRKAPADAC